MNWCWHSNTAAHKTGLQLAGTWSWSDFSSLQFKMVSRRLENPTCAPPHLSEVSPMLPLKWFQCLSDWRWPSCPFKEDCLVFPLSTPLSSRRSMVWCPRLCACRFQAPQHFISSKKQVTCEGCFAPRSICSVQEFSKVDVDHGHIPACASHSSFHFLYKFTDSVRIIARVVWLSPLEAIQRRSFSSLLGNRFHLHCQQWLERCNWPHIFS